MAGYPITWEKRRTATSSQRPAKGPAKIKRQEKFATIFNGNWVPLSSNGGHLVFGPVNATSDQGHYHCEASNGVRNNISAVTALLVHASRLADAAGPSGAGRQEWIQHN